MIPFLASFTIDFLCFCDNIPVAHFWGSNKQHFGFSGEKENPSKHFSHEEEGPALHRKARCNLPNQSKIDEEAKAFLLCAAQMKSASSPFTFWGKEDIF